MALQDGLGVLCIPSESHKERSASSTVTSSATDLVSLHLLTMEDEFILQIQPYVVFDGQEVGCIGSLAAVALQVGGVDRPMDLGRLEVGTRDLDEVEEFVEDVRMVAPDVTLVRRLDVSEDWLDRVTIGVTLNDQRIITDYRS